MVKEAQELLPTLNVGVHVLCVLVLDSALKIPTFKSVLHRRFKLKIL